MPMSDDQRPTFPRGKPRLSLSAGPRTPFSIERALANLTGDSPSSLIEESSLPSWLAPRRVRSIVLGSSGI